MICYFRTLALSLTFCLSVFCGLAQAGKLTVTAYNNGLALISETRAMLLPKGQGIVEFPGVAQTIQPETLQVNASSGKGDFRVLDMNYEFDLVSVKNLLDRYVGQELTVVLPSSTDANERVVTRAALIANNDRPVFQTEDGIFIGSYESILLPKLPKGLRARPALMWLVDNKGPDRRDVNVSYLANSLGWKADYVLKLTDEQSGSLDGWVTLTNRSGIGFENATLQLVAGDVNTVRPPSPMLMRKGAVMAEAAAMDDVSQESVFEYHLYSVNRPVTVKNNQIKQVGLLASPKVKVDRELVSRFSVQPGVAGTRKSHPDVYLAFQNSRKSGLGMPLPAGIMRAYQESSSGSTIFLGEDHIEHTPKNGHVRLAVGRAFDLTVERTQVKNTKLSKRSYELTYELSINNAKDGKVMLAVEEQIPGQWKLLKSSRPYSVKDAATARFDLTIPPTTAEKPYVLTYTVRVSY